MKKLFVPAAVLACFALGCQPPPAGNNQELINRIEKLEKKVKALEKRPAAKKRPERKPQTAAYQIPVGESPVMGSKDAKVNVIIFSDYQCPYCGRVDPFLHDLVKDDSLKGKVNVSFKHFPLSFHKQAKGASKAALAAREQGEEKFWEYSKKLYSDQRNLTSENFSKWAKEIGLNVARFEKDLKANDAKYEAQIKADMTLGTSKAKVRGTPSIFVNGWELRDRSVNGVKKMIQAKKLGA